MYELKQRDESQIHTRNQELSSSTSRVNFTTKDICISNFVLAVELLPIIASRIGVLTKELYFVHFSFSRFFAISFSVSKNFIFSLFLFRSECFYLVHGKEYICLYIHNYIYTNRLNRTSK